jgi:hypothetical protein
VSAPEHIQKFEEAMRAANPEKSLYHLAVSLRDEGMSQTDLYALFQKFQVQTSGEDPRYDAIVDTMDLIYGGSWAKGHALFSTELGRPI